MPVKYRSNLGRGIGASGAGMEAGSGTAAGWGWSGVWDTPLAAGVGWPSASGA
jgi:hypothetical protein